MSECKHDFFSTDHPLLHSYTCVHCSMDITSPAFVWYTESRQLRTENTLLKLREIVQDVIDDLDEELSESSSTLLNFARDKLQEALLVEV